MITYLEGDATEPVGDGQKIIVHVNNDLGGWGKGFVVALSKKWAEPEQQYRTWHKDGHYTTARNTQVPFGPGQVQAVRVADEIIVVNMVAQNGYHPVTEPPYINYQALRFCLGSVASLCVSMDQPVSVHMPRIGCGLAGGDWSIVEEIVESNLVAAGVPVFVYDLPGTA